MALEANQLADALDMFWNAAIGHVRADIYASTTANEVINAIAVGFAAVAQQLREDERKINGEDSEISNVPTATEPVTGDNQ